MLGAVSNGSKPALTAQKRHFCSTPNNGHRHSLSACLKRAISGLMHRSNCVPFDDLVCTGEERRRYLKAKRFSGLEIEIRSTARRL